MSLRSAIYSKQWCDAVKLAKESPLMASAWTRVEKGPFGKMAKVLPLHEALVRGAPLECVRALVKAYPQALGKPESSYKRLPLHCACRQNADPRVVGFLVRSSKAACVTPDSLERLPIHYALTNGANAAVVEILVNACPEAARSQDHKGWSPAHVAVKMGASEFVVRLLLEAHPEVVLAQTNQGNSIQRIIPKACPHRKELKSLVAEIMSEVNATSHLPKTCRDSVMTERKLVDMWSFA